MNQSDSQLADLVLSDPLILFDLYPMLQARYVEELGVEIKAILDNGMGSDAGVVDSKALQSAHAKFWFWVLGCYELIRTLYQHRECFSDDCQMRMGSLKRQISPIRVAFAKLEIQNAQRIPGQVDFLDRSPFFSIAGIDVKEKDFKFVITGQTFGMRALIEDFSSFKNAMVPSDVVRRLYHKRLQASE